MASNIQSALDLMGIREMSEAQAEVTHALLDGRDAFAILATGAGKSACYQIPALANSDGLAIVISPLISLMEDQVSQMKSRGLPVERVHSGMSPEICDEIASRVSGGQVRLLYLSPERLVAGGAIMAAAARQRISLFAVDEAHCISMWGNDFRRDYLKIRGAIDLLASRQARRPAVLAVTATAPAEVEKDVIAKLGLRDPLVFRGSVRRHNLRLSAIRTHDRKRELSSILRANRDDIPAIVYCSTVKATMSVRDHLIREGVFAAAYHGQMSAEERHESQSDFVANRVPVMVATGAFGMGVNKSDIRAIYHYQMPRDVSTYYQEIGRAGRDGKPAAATLLFNDRDVSLHEFMARSAWPARNDIVSAIQVISYLESSGPYGDYASGQMSALCREVSRLHPNTLDERDVRRIVLFLADMGAMTSYRTGPGRDDVAVSLRSTNPDRLERILDSIDEMRERSIARISEMWRFADDASSCRQASLDRIIGRGGDASRCGNCDNCLTPSALNVPAKRDNNGLPKGAERVLGLLRDEVTRISERDRVPPFAVASPAALRKLAGKIAELSEGSERDVLDSARIPGIGGRYEDEIRRLASLILGRTDGPVPSRDFTR